MAADLQELRDRMTYVRERRAELNKEINAHLLGSLDVRDEVNAAERTYRTVLKLVKPLLTRYPAAVGMLANEIRACLDGLACQLAIRNGKTTAGVYFPISKSQAIFEDDGMRKIRKLSTADQAAIVALNPFRGGSGVLFGLHEADRIRKGIIYLTPEMRSGRYLLVMGISPLI